MSRLTDRGFVPIPAEVQGGYTSDKYRSLPTADTRPQASRQPVYETNSPVDGSALSR